MSIRLRLTLVYTLILAVISIAFSLILYFGFSRTTGLLARQRFNETANLLVRAALTEQSLEEIRPFRPPPGPAGGPPLGPDTGPPPPPVPDLLTTSYYQVRTLDGEILRKSDNLTGTIPLTARDLHTLSNGGREWTGETTLSTGENVLVLNRQVARRGDTPVIVQVAQATWGRDQGLQILAQSLIVGNIVIIVAAFGIGWFMAGYSLRPIKRIQQTAQAIGAEHDFGRRVNYSGPNDEVGQLATTFNAMLGELQSAYLHVEESLTAQRRFVADASHELRTPLTTVRGNLGLLQRRPVLNPAEQAEVVSDLVAETERLMRLVNDLLLLARADAQRPLRREPVSISSLLHEVCQQARVLAPQRTVTCTGDDAVVTADRDSLKQVLLVLVDNALKHTPSTAKVAVHCARSANQVQISVSDTGPGISPELLPHIFNRFYRGDEARSGGGAGLGLAIARELTEAQQGSLAVSSRPGKGTTFTLTFAPV